MGRPLYKIIDLDSRKNEKLALIAHDYIHERWSAGRVVTPEIWRLVVGFVTPEIAKDLVSAVHNGDELTKRAAFKTIKKSSFYHENEMPNEALFYKNISWNAIGAQQYTQLKF